MMGGYTYNKWQRSQQVATRNKGKEIVNSSPLTYDQEPEMVTEDDTLSKEKEIDRLMALISLSFKKIYKPTNNNLRTSSNTSRANQDNTPRINKGTGYDNQRAVNVLNAEQADWRDDTDDEPDDQELEAHYIYMAQIQEVTPDNADNFGHVFDAEPLHKVQNNGDNYNVFAIKKRDDQEDNDDLAKERDLLASLIVKLKYFKNKNECLESSNTHFKEANDELKKTNQMMFKDLKKFQDELEKRHDVNYMSKVELDCAKAKMELIFVKPEFLNKAQRANPRLYDIGCYNDNIALMLAPESDETIHLAQESRSKLKEMVADLRYFNSLEHEADSLKSQLETNKTKFWNEIDRLSREYYYTNQMNAILGVYTTLDEFTDLQCDYMDQVFKCERLEKELSKSKTVSKSFEALQEHAIDLELALQQYKEQVKNDKAFEENKSNVFLKEYEQYFEIQDLKAQLQDKGIAVRVSPNTSVSRPQFKSNQLEDTVMTNNSQGKKQEVEDHHRNFKFTNNKTFVTACNDNLNAKTSNVNFICVTCGKLLENPSELGTASTNQKPRSTIRKKYEQFSKTCNWWYPKFTPSGYKWKPKSPIGNVHTIVSMPLGNESRTANVLEPKTPRCSTISNTLLSSNSFAARRNNSIHRRLWVLKAHDRKSQASIRDLKGNDLLTDGENIDKMKEKGDARIFIGLMFDELLNGTTLVMSKSSDVTTADAPNQRQQQHTTPSTSTTVAADTPLLNIHTTPKTTNQAPTVTSIENINQAET
ncbi:hypothetical protein Tco_0018508 [Tanacetum coccineum]